MKHRPNVVILGGGFGGLNAAKGLRRSEVSVTLVDKTNHHLFQPLLYQVATAALSPADIAAPLRTIFRKQRNVRVLMDEAVGIDRTQRIVQLKNGRELVYDYLVVAVGNRPSYYGNDDWAEHAPGLKTLDDALRIRERILLSFEQAARFEQPEERRRYLNFAVVGGGPTGVEMAGAIQEIGAELIRREFPSLTKEELQVSLIEGSDRLLRMYSPSLSDRTRRDLETMGVRVHLNTFVKTVTDDALEAGDLRIETVNIVWAAGNQGQALLNTLQAEQNKAGQVLVGPDLALPDDENVFVIGDAAYSVDKDGNPHPGVAQTAVQGGKYVAKVIAGQVRREWRPAFRYFDKGNMATIGRGRAILESGPIRLAGVIAWFAWATVHIFYLIGFRNQLSVMWQWFWAYVRNTPGSRLIYWREEAKREAAATERQPEPVVA